MNQKQNKSNLLIHESSPYLLQHAYNPVHWRPWNQESLLEAQKTNKPLLISIGYSACHWCHVMERESFEDSAVAELMNQNFICIKVDREERPDIDHLYMDAVQLMTGRGGWPLNCFALPNGKPFYGGTYFPKEQWVNVLEQLSQLYTNDVDKVIEYAEKLSEGLKQSDLIKRSEKPDDFEAEQLKKGIEKWKTNIDTKDGGNNYAPKFPMPNNYQFLLHYLYYNNDEKISEHLKLTLQSMAFGGIYDQIGGGFARYSTDMEWKVPHFEKMLYDNAQLISLYSQAYKYFQDPLYQEVVEECIGFLQREMHDESGAFYSALDADSEEEEGKFYCWQKAELQEILTSEEYDLTEIYFNVNSKGLWEHNYILLRDKNKESICKELNLNLKDLNERIASIKGKLLTAREGRVRPGIDDKSLTSWNALIIIGLLDAYEAFGNEAYIKQAIQTANFILEKQLNANGQLFHNYKNGQASINGFLEDYSFSIEAFIKLYENTFDIQWLKKSELLLNHCLKHFYDENSSYFYFNSDLDPQLVSRKIEKNDNVIPSSNSSLCKGMYKLGILLENDKYLAISDQMLANSIDMINNHLPYASNWGQQLLSRGNPLKEVAIVGPDALTLKGNLDDQYLPNCIFLGELKNQKSLELLHDKWVEGSSIIYVCENKTCQLPVESIEAAIEQIHYP